MRDVWPRPAVLLAVLSLARAQAAEPPARGDETPASLRLSAERIDDRIVVRIGERTFTCYRFGAGQKYPYLYPLNGPRSGLSVTTESSLPYPHHRSLFFGCDRVNGGNFWQEGNERGQIVSRGPTIVRAGPDRVEIADRCDWRLPGAEPILSDRREIRIEAPSADLRLINFKISLIPATDVRIDRTNHSLFAARVDPDLSPQAGGVLLSSGGATGEKATLSMSAAWCDVSGTRFGLREGIAIFDSPLNRWYPARWFTRDYGFFSPTPLNWLDDAGLRLPAGEPLDLEYQVAVHGGDAAEARIATLFSTWAAGRAGGRPPSAGTGPKP
jgi:hypothetical protein